MPFPSRPDFEETGENKAMKVEENKRPGAAVKI